MGAVVQYAGQVMVRAHALFGEPSVARDASAMSASALLTDAAGLSGAGRQNIAGLAGRLPTGYGTFAADAGIRLDGLATADDHLGAQLRDAAATDRSGRNASGAVLDGAVVDTARMAPLTGTPAGQRALVAALRDRVAQQQRVIEAYRLRDARMAALLRTLSYRRGPGLQAGGGITPFGGGSASGGMGGGGPSLAPATWPGRGNGSQANPHLQEVSTWSVPAGPGGDAVAAALSKRGRPYVWGAKGPNVFDCSGLTQWAWRQAGVQLGGDTYAQIEDGIPVRADQVRAGDLIFPTSSFGEGGQPGPGHVMLAISATEVVHAPHSGDAVRVAPMPAGFVARRPVPPTLA